MRVEDRFALAVDLAALDRSHATQLAIVDLPTHGSHQRPDNFNPDIHSTHWVQMSKLSEVVQRSRVGAEGSEEAGRLLVSQEMSRTRQF